MRQPNHHRSSRPILRNDGCFAITNLATYHAPVHGCTGGLRSRIKDCKDAANGEICINDTAAIERIKADRPELLVGTWSRRRTSAANWDENRILLQERCRDGEGQHER